MPATKPPDWSFFWVVALSLLGFLALFVLANNVPSTEVIPYSEFQKYLDAGKVTKVTVSGDTIRGELSEKLPGGNTVFRTDRVAPDLANDLARHGVEFTGAPTSGALGSLLSWIVPPLIFVGIWLLATRGMAGGGLGGGLLSAGRSRAKLVAETDVNVTFSDVAGVDEAKEELHEIIDFLKHPEEIHPAGRAYPTRNLAGRAARHRQDPARSCHGRRSGRAVLLDQRRRVCRNVRGRRRRACP